MEDLNILSKLRPVDAKSLKYKDDDSSSSDSEKLSCDDLKHGVTKKIKKMARRKKKYRFITDEMRVQLVDAVDAGEKIKHAAKRLKINYSSAKSIFKVFKREGRFSHKVLKPKAPPKVKAAPKLTEESDFSGESEEIEDDESIGSPENSCNPFLKKEYEEVKENIKQELQSPEPEIRQVSAPQVLESQHSEVDAGFLLQQLHQKQQRQQRNFQPNPSLFGLNMTAKVNPNMPFTGNQGYSFRDLYTQQQMNLQKQHFGAIPPSAQMLNNLKPSNFNGIGAPHFGNFIPQQQPNLAQLNYSMLGNVLNQQQQQQFANPFLMQQQSLQQMNYSSYPNMNYLEAMMAREQGLRVEANLRNVKAEDMNSNFTKFEYSEI